MDDHDLVKQELLSRLGWLVRLRWLAIAGILAATAVLAAVQPERARLDKPPMTLVIATALVVLIYNLWLRGRVSRLQRPADGSPARDTLVRLASLQIGLDLLALAWLVHLAGGIENPFALFFVFHIIIAGILLGPAISYLAAAGAWLLYLLVTGLEYAGLLPHYHLALAGTELYRVPLFVVAANGALGLTLFGMAYLTTSITARLRQRELDLQSSVATTEAKSLELQALNDQLRRVDSERTRFITLVTHELRSPLSIIYSAFDVVLSGYASLDEARDVMARAQNRAEELLELVDDLLELTRQRESTARPQHPAAAHPAGPLRDVLDFMRREIEGKGLSLSVEIAPDLPLVRTEADQMKLIWTNLLTNAAKYTPSGGSIRIALGYTPTDVVGTVEDTGIGIGPDDLPRVFDEFFRAKNARQTTAHGTGVGLSIVRRIVDNCGGSIEVASEVNEGSRFTFKLPRA